MIIDNTDKAKEVYSELWAFMQLAQVYAEGVATGKYSDTKSLGEHIHKTWVDSIEELAREFGHWVRSL